MWLEALSSYHTTDWYLLILDIMTITNVDQVFVPKVYSYVHSYDNNMTELIDHFNELTGILNS